MKYLLFFVFIFSAFVVLSDAWADNVVLKKVTAHSHEMNVDLELLNAPSMHKKVEALSDETKIPSRFLSLHHDWIILADTSRQCALFGLPSYLNWLTSSLRALPFVDVKISLSTYSNQGIQHQWIQEQPHALPALDLRCNPQAYSASFDQTLQDLLSNHPSIEKSALIWVFSYGNFTLSEKTQQLIKARGDFVRLLLLNPSLFETLSLTSKENSVVSVQNFPIVKPPFLLPPIPLKVVLSPSLEFQGKTREVTLSFIDNEKSIAEWRGPLAFPDSHSSRFLRQHGTKILLIIFLLILLAAAYLSYRYYRPRICKTCKSYYRRAHGACLCCLPANTPVLVDSHGKSVLPLHSFPKTIKEGKNKIKIERQDWAMGVRSFLVKNNGVSRYVVPGETVFLGEKTFKFVVKSKLPLGKLGIFLAAVFFQACASTSQNPVNRNLAESKDEIVLTGAGRTGILKKGCDKNSENLTFEIRESLSGKIQATERDCKTFSGYAWIRTKEVLAKGTYKFNIFRGWQEETLQLRTVFENPDFQSESDSNWSGAAVLNSNSSHENTVSYNDGDFTDWIKLSGNKGRVVLSLNKNENSPQAHLSATVFKSDRKSGSISLVSNLVENAEKIFLIRPGTQLLVRVRTGLFEGPIQYTLTRQDSQGESGNGNRTIPVIDCFGINDNESVAILKSAEGLKVGDQVEMEARRKGEKFQSLGDCEVVSVDAEQTSCKLKSVIAAGFQDFVARF